MLLERIESTEKHLRDFIQQHFGLHLHSRLTVEPPPYLEMGDLAFPFPFELAKILHRAPQLIAQEVVEKVAPPPQVERLEAAGAGYVNVFFKRGPFFHDLYEWLTGSPISSAPGEESDILVGGKDKIIVEHTNINPNKAAHIGHLRNAVLGDTFARLLRSRSHWVEVQNYIDNTGLQVADVVVGFRYLRRLSLPQIKAIDHRFDYYCWDLYAEVSNWYTRNESRLRYRSQVLKKIEQGGNEIADLAEHISMRIVRAHLDTMLRVGVRYDVLPRESEILQLKFWHEAFQQLRKQRVILFANDGPNRGCWIFQLDGQDGQPGEEKVIVRSDGTVTYVGKDIAYQLWKFGLLQKTFHYRPFYRYLDGTVAWTTTTQPYHQDEPKFGGGKKVYNVIDVRQAYLQRIVTEGVRSLGFHLQAEQSTHFSYEMVALSPDCCRELHIALSDEEQKKPYLEVSGRKGLGVRADDLIDKLIEKSILEVNRRQKALSPEKRTLIAQQIAVGALRYFLLKYSRTSVIAFDFSEVLNFEGETGPYLQYSVVRANNIFRKLESERGLNWLSATEEPKKVWKQSYPIPQLVNNNEVWGLLLETARLDEAIDQSLRTLEMSCLTKQAFTLARLFNLFYHRHHILSEKDGDKKRFYLLVTDTARRGLEKALDLLGIEVPERM